LSRIDLMIVEGDRKMPDRNDKRGERNRGNQQGFGQMSDRKRRDAASKGGRSHGDRGSSR
jgi:hypothetical protein